MLCEPVVSVEFSHFHLQVSGKLDLAESFFENVLGWEKCTKRYGIFNDKPTFRDPISGAKIVLFHLPIISSPDLIVRDHGLAIKFESFKSLSEFKDKVFQWSDKLQAGARVYHAPGGLRVTLPAIFDYCIQLYVHD